MSGILGDNTGRESGLLKSASVSQAIKKTYHKMWRGGHSFTGHPYNAPTIIPTYQYAITPSSSDSVFLATYNLVIGAQADHCFIKAVAMIDGGSWTYLGTTKASMYNDVGYFDFGTMRISGATTDTTVGKSHSFYYAPATTSEITFALYAGQHGDTSYFGEAQAGDGADDDYSAVGMSIRVDEYSSSSDLVATEYTSG